MIRTGRWLVRALLLIVALVLAGTFIPRPLVQLTQAGEPQSRNILLLSNPIHTDLAIPLDDDLRRRFAFLSEAGLPIDNPAARYLVIGWGGRSFYLETPQWADIKPLPVFKALTIDRSVMHVALAGEIAKNADDVTPLSISKDGEQRMLDFIEHSFVMNGDTPALIRNSGYGRYDAFYEAHGFFNALVGCNTWTARALREAGLRTGVWNPVPQTLAVSLQFYN